MRMIRRSVMAMTNTSCQRLFIGVSRAQGTAPVIAQIIRFQVFGGNILVMSDSFYVFFVWLPPYDDQRQ
ncbi:uncharacterized protein METZ01_LOCUS181146 [marine metagenome]|uniref:Uncharacterized protein n=1 Tax=marine metagenome TaxID=408172 RepID=A0A382CR57_9ZZZZ